MLSGRAIAAIIFLGFYLCFILRVLILCYRSVVKMPKALSLKKVQQKGPLMNQKPITQFFKNVNPAATQTVQNSPVKTQKHQEKLVDKKPMKRKVLSPVNLETIEILDETSSNNSCKTLHNLKKGEHSPKKIKTHNNCNTPRSPDKSAIIGGRPPHKENGFIKLSPYEENGINENLSPIKSRNLEHKTLLVDKLESKNNHEENSHTNKDRSPLSPVKADNLNEGNRSPNKVSCSTSNHQENKLTPKKRSKNDVADLQIPNKKMPKKSSRKVDVLNYPHSAKLTPEKLKDIASPSKSGSTVKSLDLGQLDIEDGFGDDWELGDVEEACEELDLSRMQRCEVTSLRRHPTRLEVRLKSAGGQGQATCFVEGLWLDTPLTPGELISVTAGRDRSGSYCVSNTAGLISVRPDHLMSATSVVGGVFCQRKALLQERWRGIDSANTAMTIGILIHELVQKALTQNITDITQLQSETDKILKESVQSLYDAGLTVEEARSNIQMYIQPLAEFMRVYVAGKPPTVKPQKDQWAGRIEKVLDIEENVCCPQLGLKGKIDATVEVTIHERKGRPRRQTVPLELKSGKPSVSAEHRGQLVLYGMMLSAVNGLQPDTEHHTSLLLYLKERVELHAVSCGYPERRDLIMLRNQLVQYLATGPDDLDPEQLTDIEDASLLIQQRLPEPIHHASACAKCPYLTLCSLHLWHTDGPSVSKSHPLSTLQAQALGHLSPQHIKYFLQWTAMLRIEERCQMLASPLHALWTENVQKRSKRGTCASNLLLKSIEKSGEKYLHIFDRPTQVNDTASKDGKAVKGPQEGDFSTVSLDNRPWIAAGVVTAATDTHISILLERDLSSRAPKDTVFHIDTYESYATTVQNLTNLGMLLEDSDRAERLRSIIIDKQPCEFDQKLPREVGRLGTKLMRSLNIQQQRAVLKALSAKHYALLQGLPGTGKTQTISVLIQMLVGLKQRVLVTAHTHSAVDNVLARLPSSIKIMRLGSSSRVAPSLLGRCEQSLAADCETPEQLGKLYDSMEVVGVTCLGAAHAMLARTTFDVCIMDEATQVVQSTALRPLLFARRFLLAGDPDQLPPVVRSRAARRLGMEESLFHRLMSEEATSTLQLQYRMNQPLADMANKVAYNFRLKCADDKVANATLDVDLTKLYECAPWLLQCCDPEPDHAAIFLDMAAFRGSANDSKACSNVEEACVVLALVDVLVKGGVSPQEIGVIAPYRDQVALLRRCIAQRGIECSTVDQFQGRDKSVILYSCTKRVSDKEVKEGEILNDQRRLAVSVTRAKHKLLVVGDSRALQRYKPLRTLVEACYTVALEHTAICTLINKYKTDIV